MTTETLTGTWELGFSYKITKRDLQKRKKLEERWLIESDERSGERTV